LKQSDILLANEELICSLIPLSIKTPAVKIDLLRVTEISAEQVSVAWKINSAKSFFAPRL
jgi:hypothetical protein